MPKIALACAAAFLVASCSPTASNSVPTAQSETASAPAAASGDAATADAISVVGPVKSVVDGMFTMNAGSGLGFVHVYTASATFSGVYLKAGTYATVVGTGSTATSIRAATIDVTAEAPPTVHLTGEVTSVVNGMFTMNAGSGTGYVHVYTTGAAINGLYLKTGTYADVTGTGSAATSVVAASVNVSEMSSAGAVPLHVLTADYLGSPDGTHSISWRTAAQYLTWAETGIADATAISAAGIKTMFYVDPNREQTGSQLDTTVEAAYAHTCAGRRVTDVYDGDVTQYVTNPASAAMQKVFSTYVSSIAAQAHFDAIFEDDSGALSAFTQYDTFSAMPCDYSDASWIAGEIALNKVSPIPIIFNGLSGLNGHDPSLSIGILANGNTIGGIFEQCYASQTQPKMDGWLWTTIENTELQVAAQHKIFQCMGTDTAAAGAATGSRIYAYASFLMGYDPTTSVYRTQYGTASGLHVFPEMGLVALQPSISLPAKVSSLLQSGGTYARRFGACYLAGASLGPCAVVVNPDQSAAHPFPFTQFHHTLKLSGNGTLDGGKASANGAAPPATVPFDSAIIALP